MPLRQLVLMTATLATACATSSPKPAAQAAAAAAPVEPAAPAAAEAKRPSSRPLMQSMTRPVQGKLLSLREMMQLLDASPVQYEVSVLQPLKEAERPKDLFAAAWPARRQPFDIPTLVAAQDGSRHVAPYPLRKDLQARLDAVEPAFQAKRYAEADRAYADIVASAPDYYPALLSYGDAAVFAGRDREALARYSSAHQANPHDHRAHFYRSTALRHLGRLEEAREELAWALTLRPGYPTIVEVLKTSGQHVGARLEPQRLVPRAYVRKQGDKVSVYLDAKGSAAWLAWGMCKAMWRGEPAHRKALLGREDDVWSSIEELECLGALLTAYGGERKKGQRDPELERVWAVVEAGFHRELLHYEIYPRIDPHASLSLDEAERARLHDYVSRYVMPPAQAAAPAGP